ncbi:unnamed protein product [Trichobilharzia szidati]|nr:unnamed protein product [Trichobilharzia szidati]
MYQTKNTEQKECTLKQLREKVEEMQVLYMEHDNQLREQMGSVLMNLEIEQTARKDASLEIEKSNVQLDVSKKSYYEVSCSGLIDLTFMEKWFVHYFIIFKKNDRIL